MPDEAILTIQIICHNFPGRTFNGNEEVELGIQRGRDSIDVVPGDAPEAVFTAHLRVEQNIPTGKPNFLGPYAHGTPENRFLYLSWSGVRDGGRAMFRRAKILLRILTWEQVAQAITESRPIIVRASMTAKDGGPVCATLTANVEWEV